MANGSKGQNNAPHPGPTAMVRKCLSHESKIFLEILLH